MQTSGFAITLLLGSILSLAGCSQGTAPQGAAAGQSSMGVTADGRKLRPLTDMEIAQDAYSKGDFPKALDHFRAAAVAGDADAMYYTGVMYAEAQGVAKPNMPEAVRWYEKAAARDQPKALLTMGRLHVTGYAGVEQDPKKALEMFERAVKASPAGEERDEAEEQRAALAAVLESQGKTAANAAEGAAKP